MPESDLLKKFSFLKDTELSEDLKKFLLEKSIQVENAAWTNQLEIKKWRWSTPLAVALTGAITIGVNFAFDYWRANQKQTLDLRSGDAEARRKAAATEREFQFRIVERELSQDKPERDRAQVLLFLVRSGVLSGLNESELRAMAQDTIDKKPGAVVPSLGSLRQNPDARRAFCNMEYRIASAGTISSTGTIEISSEWLASNLTEIAIPQLKRFIPDGKVRFHKIAVTALKNAFAEIEEKGLLDRILSWDGAFVPRTISWNPNRPPSIHACGIAFDINASWNGLGEEPAPAGKHGSVIDLVPIFEKHGFEWGGRWAAGLRDSMHFEYVIPPPIK